MRTFFPSPTCPLLVREYQAAEDTSGSSHSRLQTVILLHGGPAAAGYMSSVAHGLLEQQKASPAHPGCTILEPFQRNSKTAKAPSGAHNPECPFTVDIHVDDLHAVISTFCAPDNASCTPRPHIVGHSWGAMLGLAYCAAYPESAASLSLIGCGSFTAHAREQMMQTVDVRMTPALHEELNALMDLADHDARLCALAEAITPIYGFDYAYQHETPQCDAKAHEQTWEDMIARQQDGTYPQAFARITTPVAMFHGSYDPHPGKLIQKSLLPLLPHLHYKEYTECGHDIWRERRWRKPFFTDLHNWLMQNSLPSPR